MRRGGDSYYVLVNKDGEEYTIEDYCDTYVMDYDSWELAEQELKEMLEEEELFEEDGWHVERRRW